MGPVAILPVVTEDLPISPRFTPYDFLSRCKFSTLTTRQPMNFTYSRTNAFRYGRQNKNPADGGKNRTHDFRTTSRCASYLLDHSGDKRRNPYRRNVCFTGDIDRIGILAPCCLLRALGIGRHQQPELIAVVLDVEFQRVWLNPFHISCIGVKNAAFNILFNLALKAS